MYIAGTGAYSFIATLPDFPDRLAGPPKPGRFNEDARTTPCDELVLAYRDSSVLNLLVPCTADHGTAVLAVDAQFTELRLPKGATVAGPVEIEDLDHDGHQDLVAIAARGPAYEIDVAYGRGDGTFDSTLRSGATTSPDGTLGVSVVVGNGFPLAVRDLDGDAMPDWVDASVVHLARADGSVIAAHNPGAPWTSAIIGRFDGDALPDVAVGSKLAPGLSVYLNAGDGTLTAFSLPTRGTTTMLASGDFDGDRITDIVAANTIRVKESDSSPDTLSIAFGSPFGAPSDPKDVGEFYRIHELATARVAAGDVSVVQASIRLSDTTFSAPLGSSFDWEHVLFGLVNLDGVPGDEAVLLGPRADGSGHQVAVARADATNGARTYVLGPETAVDEVFTRTEVAPVDPSAPNGRLRFADLQADGAQDVLVLGERDRQGELLVYFNDGTGELGSALRVPGTESLDVRDFTVGEADGDAGEEVVLLTTTGVYVVDGTKRELTLGPSQLIADGPSGPASLIDAGDVDGDGVLDLAIAEPDGIQIHLGASRNPRDAR